VFLDDAQSTLKVIILMQKKKKQHSLSLSPTWVLLCFDWYLISGLGKGKVVVKKMECDIVYG